MLFLNLSRKLQEEIELKVWNLLTHPHRVSERTRGEGAAFVLFMLQHPIPYLFLSYNDFTLVTSSLKGASSKGVGRIAHEMVSSSHPLLIVDYAVLHKQLNQI